MAPGEASKESQAKTVRCRVRRARRDSATAPQPCPWQRQVCWVGECPLAVVSFWEPRNVTDPEPLTADIISDDEVTLNFGGVAAPDPKRPQSSEHATTEPQLQPPESSQKERLCREARRQRWRWRDASVSEAQGLLAPTRCPERGRSRPSSSVPGGNPPCKLLALASWPPECARSDFCCEAPGLWHFVTAALGNKCAGELLGRGGEAARGHVAPTGRLTARTPAPVQEDPGRHECSKSQTRRRKPRLPPPLGRSSCDPPEERKPGPGGGQQQQLVWAGKHKQMLLGFFWNCLWLNGRDEGLSAGLGPVRGGGGRVQVPGKRW